MRHISFLFIFLFVGNCFAQNIPNELVGIWSNNSFPSSRNASNSLSVPVTSTTFEYVFSANGDFNVRYFTMTTISGCTNSLLNYKTGKVEVNGDQITFTPTKDTWKTTASCTPKSDKYGKNKLKTETFTWRIKQYEKGKPFISLMNARGENYYWREEK